MVTTTHSPQNLIDVLSILGQEKCIILAGGTDLMVKRRGSCGTLPSFDNSILFIHKVDSLKKIYVDEKNLHIGSGASLTDILENVHTPNILKQAISTMASPAIRNIGTIGGNVCNASPAGDTLPVLIALGANVLLESSNSLREMPVQSFITGPGKTQRNVNEILKSVIIPMKKYEFAEFRKVGTRKANAISKLSFCGILNKNGRIIEDIRISFGALAPIIIRNNELEETLTGKKIRWVKNNITEIMSSYGKLLVPIDDQRSTASYRKQVALSILQDFIENTVN